ncbi:MAG TPA: serine hydrolase, partial [Acidimicrobiales bacterium]
RDDDPVPGDEWQVDDPADHGIDAATLEQARDYAFQDGRNTQGVVVVHDGAIVAEWYADGAGPDSWAASWSMAKSFTSALVGIAIEDGLIPGVDEPMSTWYPEWAEDERAAITLEDVLQMSSGLQWNENYDPAQGMSDVIAMVTGPSDQLAFVSDPAVDVEPQVDFNYSSGSTMLLSGVLEQATGMPPHEYVRQEIFEPLGMDQAEWWQDAEGHTLTYCCLDTTSRGFARFGLLFEREGEWGDEQVVPEEWVEASLTPGAATDGQYGYQWWLGQPEGFPEDFFAARGHDGQFIYVVPSLDLVVVRNGTYVKDDGPAVADPTLFEHYPSDGLVPGRGTTPPDEWDEATFLGPIIEAVQAAEDAEDAGEAAGDGDD